MRLLRPTVSPRWVLLGSTLCLFAGVPQVGQSLTVDLSPTPPDVSATVDPNIVVTFDDSGSMASDFMGDNRPFDNGSWSGPWRCAGTIDPRVTTPTDRRSEAMNGVYYNPNIVYSPPVKANGALFPVAPAALTAVWRDGVDWNRPSSPSTSDGTQNFLGTKVGSTDNRWTCGWGTNPLTNAGGPYYYRFKNTVSFVDASNNPIPATLYNAANWEAVAVTPAEYQNWANWYAYYHTRNLMTRTALSRVFGSLGENIRVAFQNINNGTYLLPAAAIITNLTDTNTTGFAVANNYRTNFFNWIFQVGASGTTPDRAATIRAGEFFRRTNTSDLRDPYWQPATAGLPGRELSCRQNFHMLVTDGYWNEGDPTLPGGFVTSESGFTFPDGKAYAIDTPDTRIYSDVAGTLYQSSLANIAFHYWANDLRPGSSASGGLDNKVPPYVPDKSINLNGTGTLPNGTDPLTNNTIYFNPKNDPATWQHVVQFMVTLGIAGRLDFPDDYQSLRQNLGKTWPRPINNSPEGVDDTWHAAVNSRGSYFSANDPSKLVSYLTDIINSIIARRGSSTALTVTLPIISNGTQGFRAGYDTSDWSGFLTKVPLDASGEPTGTPTWDAGCNLTGTSANPCPTMTSTPPNTTGTPAFGSRVIFTSDGTAGSGKPFKWANLSSAQQARLNVDPASLQLHLIPPTWTTDGFGQQRLDYIRGDRTRESAATPPILRRRSSVLGPVVNAQPVYVSSPTSGYGDNFPNGTPENTAARAGNSYTKFVFDNRARPPTVYAAANDGMLHAFNAVDGSERWAFVPNTVIDNFNLTKSTKTGSGLTPTVDDQPIKADVFLSGQWRTILLGSLRLGGRGVYMLDITNPAGATDASAGSIVRWEFSNMSPGGANLGYTYGSTNIARLNNGKWVALVSSGYFPKDSLDPASRDAAANIASLFVLDIATGAVLRELRTSTAPQAGGVLSYGLGRPAPFDFGDNMITDIAVAGDLAGNLWRFDLSDANAANWKVDLMFRAYGSGGINSGDRPITVMPVGMRDPGRAGLIWVFGTGKYIGLEDRTSAIPQQAFFGIRDYGTNAAEYPIQLTQLTAQVLTQDAGGVRLLTTNAVPPASRGWTFPLNISAEAGERNVVTATALDSSNRAILATLIPKGNDPCDPGRRGAIMVVDAASGGASRFGVNVGSSNPNAVGKAVTSEGIPLVGGIPLQIPEGGGSISIPGIPIGSIPDFVWHRDAWRDLLETE